jgi:hypothetical protein
MPNKGDTIFIDTCAIEGAHASNCWNGIYKNYKLKTEDFCIGEAVRRNREGNKLIKRDPEELRKEIECLVCPEEDVLDLGELLHDAADLDTGEKRLLALALKHTEAWLICGPDIGTLRALLHLSKLGKPASMNNMCALEEMTQALGMRTSFNTKVLHKLSKKWLQAIRMDLLSGMR